MNHLRAIATSAKTFVRSVSRIISPARGSMSAQCVNINALLMHLCDFDQPTYRYIIKWLAYPLQNPGAKMERGILMNGQPGTGSNIFFERVVAAIYGSSARLLHARATDATFNSWVLGAAFVVVDGAATKSAIANLRALITSDSVAVDQKGQEPRVIPNHMNFVLLSHSSDFLPLSTLSRRFFAVEAPPARERLFYDAVLAEIANGGVEAFSRYLKYEVNLEGFNQFSAPPTPAANGQYNEMAVA